MIGDEVFENALCLGKTGMFFDPSQWPQAARLCLKCPCRVPCLKEALDLEAGSQERERFGLWASLTPHQRRSLELRPGAGRCLKCETWIDPAHWHTGNLRCSSCGWAGRVPPLPSLGDDWTNHTTRVARATLVILKRRRTPIPWSQLLDRVKTRGATLRRVLKELQDVGLVEDRGGWVLVRRDVDPETWVPSHLQAPRRVRNRGTIRARRTSAEKMMTKEKKQ